jgi:orotidine-5'-phosphate decarboxylase
LLVIADGKRGDIDVSAGAYASALYGGAETPFGHLEGLGADLATVQPLMQHRAIEPFSGRPRAGVGVLVLVRTSTPAPTTCRTSRWPAEEMGSASRASSSAFRRAGRAEAQRLGAAIG